MKKNKFEGNIRSQVFKTQPQTEEELYWWLFAVFGIKVPRHKVCENHRAPFEIISEQYFNKEFYHLCIGGRGCSKTYIIALVSFIKANQIPGIEISIGASTESQALQAIQYMLYFQNILGKPLFIEIFPNCFKFQNNSIIRILRHSQKSVRGSHPQILYIDEVDEMSENIFEAVIFSPISNKLHNASISIFSTRHKKGGLAKQLREESQRRGLELFEWCGLDVAKKCEYENCSGCDLFMVCMGRLKQKVADDGYIQVQDLRHVIRMGGQKALHEIFLVDIEDQLFKVDPIDIMDIKYCKELRTIAGVDWGSSEAPTVFMIIQVDDNLGQYKVIKEQILWKTKDSEAAKIGLEIMNGYLVSRFFVDPTNHNGVLEFMYLNLVVVNDFVPFQLSVEYLGELFQNKRICISHQCSSLIKELQYWKGVRNEGSYHCIDALRYAIWGDRKSKKIRQRFRIEPLKGKLGYEYKGAYF